MDYNYNLVDLLVSLSLILVNLVIDESPHGIQVPVVASIFLSSSNLKAHKIKATTDCCDESLSCLGLVILLASFNHGSRYVNTPRCSSVLLDVVFNKGKSPLPDNELERKAGSPENSQRKPILWELLVEDRGGCGVCFW